jgi:hypothetical protein
MRPANNISKRQGERGVTLLLVVVALVVILGMAALAIDVVTLYVARAEAQRAADAAALAGAKMFVTSGFTSGQLGLVTDLGAQNLACVNSGAGGTGAANQEAEAVLAQNPIAGQGATSLSITCNFAPASQPENPQITVTLQRTGLPTFFAKIWGIQGSSVSATATAEAFNPSGSSLPIKVAFVKPWLIPNCSPGGSCGTYFVDPGASYALNTPSNYIGQSFTFKQLNLGPPPPPPPGAWYYAIDPPALPPLSSAGICPANTAVSCGNVHNGDAYEDNISCGHTFEFSCGQRIGPGETVTFEQRPNSVLRTFTTEGTQCLIHASGTGPGNGQDSFNNGTSPVIIDGGDNNPNTALQGKPKISRSDSVVTVPIYDGTTDLCPGAVCTGTATVIGFLQLGIQDVNSDGSIDTVILNATGCNPGALGTPVSGGSVAPIPVRLIHN